MLVLSRKTKQRIQIGDDIVITILRIKGQSVRVGIEAPRAMNVCRAEVGPRPEPPLVAVEAISAAAPRRAAGVRRSQPAGNEALAPVVKRGCTMTSNRRPGPAPLADRMARMRTAPTPTIVPWQPAAPR